MSNWPYKSKFVPLTELVERDTLLLPEGGDKENWDTYRLSFDCTDDIPGAVLTAQSWDGDWLHTELTLDPDAIGVKIVAYLNDEEAGITLIPIYNPKEAS
jgi:hypothetical protein